MFTARVHFCVYQNTHYYSIFYIDRCVFLIACMCIFVYATSPVVGRHFSFVVRVTLGELLKLHEANDSSALVFSEPLGLPRVEVDPSAVSDKQQADAFQEVPLEVNSNSSEQRPTFGFVSLGYH